MSNEIFHAIEQVGREKGIEVDIIIQAVEDAYAAAAKKYFHSKEDLGARFDRDTGALDVYAKKKVVDEVTNPDLEISPDAAKDLDLPVLEEGIVEILKPREGLMQLGRIAAQAAKQIIFQKVREAERDNIYKEYFGRIGEMINGVVKRFERGNIVVDLGRTEAILPKKEQSKAERYSQGDRLRAVIVDVDRNAKGPQVVISRTDERLLMKLFEMEVPEIYDGTVVIERAVRDPGDRAKVAVRSKDRDVDPVGACVGMKGSRVQSIIRELRGEKIDIVQYSEDVNAFVSNALNPAKINRVHVTDAENRALEVVVDDEQLSLAIGKKGQNVRLASRLAGWKIDIKSEQEKKREVEAEMERMARDSREVESLEGVGEKTIQKMVEAGYRNIEAILAAQVEGLTQVSGIGPKSAEKILAAAQAMLESREAREAEEQRIQAEQAAAEEAAAQAAAEAEAAAQAAADAEAAAQAALEEEAAAQAAAEAGAEAELASEMDSGLDDGETPGEDPATAEGQEGSNSTDDDPGSSSDDQMRAAEETVAQDDAVTDEGDPTEQAAPPESESGREGMTDPIEGAGEGAGWQERSPAAHKDRDEAAAQAPFAGESGIDPGTRREED
jgi:transcription termination/antitermination protein NusA